MPPSRGKDLTGRETAVASDGGRAEEGEAGKEEAKRKSDERKPAEGLDAGFPWLEGGLWVPR